MVTETFGPLQKVIILNGPPGSGKDTLADLLAEDLRGGGINAQRFAFKDCLYVETAAYYHVGYDWLVEVATDRVKKETPQAALHGLTPRQALINVSENHIKPNFGKSFFGDALAREVLRSGCEYAVVSDGGFMDEMPPLLETFHVQVLRLHREGCTFDNDSRRYIYPSCDSSDIHQVEGEPNFALSAINEVLI